MNQELCTAAGERVTIWGDSLSKGVVWNAERQRHTTLTVTAASIVGDQLGIQIENRSRFGFTAPRGLALMEEDLKAGRRCDAAVIEFGGNDCDFQWQEISDDPNAPHLPATVPQAFYRTICRMVQKLMDSGIRPFLVTLPPIDAERYFRFISAGKRSAKNILKWLGDTQQIYRYQELYSNLVAKAAMRLGCRMIDIRACCLENHHMHDLLCEDGIHLTEEGQVYVGNQIAALLRRED